MSSRVRSFSDVILALLSAGTINTTWFAAKSTREARFTAFSSIALSIAFWSAEANTSAGAPFKICCSKTSDAPKFSTTLVSGCSFS
ncbi:hypothetical protein D3C78_1519990 [compost metagenome]